MNKERLMKLAEFLDSVPDEQFCIDIWQRRDVLCGTVACAMGWACEVPEFKAAGLELIQFPQTGDFVPAYKGHSSFSAAARFFELRLHEALNLFNPANYHRQEDPDHVVLPAEVAARIRSLIADEGRKADADLKNENP